MINYAYVSAICKTFFQLLFQPQIDICHKSLFVKWANSICHHICRNLKFFLWKKDLYQVHIGNMDVILPHLVCKCLAYFDPKKYIEMPKIDPFLTLM